MNFIYLATSPLVDFIKIGAWKNDVHTLRSRYATYYGPDTNVTVFSCDHRFETEAFLKENLQLYHLGGELYMCKATPLFIRFGELHCHDRVNIKARTKIEVQVKQATRARLTAKFIEERERAKHERKMEREAKKLRPKCNEELVSRFLATAVACTNDCKDRVGNRELLEHFRRYTDQDVGKHSFCDMLRKLLRPYHMPNINRPGAQEGYKCHRIASGDE